MEALEGCFCASAEGDWELRLGLGGGGGKGGDSLDFWGLMNRLSVTPQAGVEHRFLGPLCHHSGVPHYFTLSHTSATSHHGEELEAASDAGECLSLIVCPTIFHTIPHFCHLSPW